MALLELLLPLLLCTTNLRKFNLHSVLISLQLVSLLFHLEQVFVKLLVNLMALLAYLVHLSVKIIEIILHLWQVAVARAWHSVFPLFCRVLLRGRLHLVEGVDETNDLILDARVDFRVQRRNRLRCISRQS